MTLELRIQEVLFFGRKKADNGSSERKEGHHIQKEQSMQISVFDAIIMRYDFFLHENVSCA